METRERSACMTLDQLDKEGRIEWSSTGNPRERIYADESEGVYIQDIWLSVKDPKDSYPTAKSEVVLERIIKASSNEGDLIADFFCGSGTTAAVAEKLGRKWLATDLGKFAIRCFKMLQCNITAVAYGCMVEYHQKKRVLISALSHSCKILGVTFPDRRACSNRSNPEKLSRRRLLAVIRP